MLRAYHLIHWMVFCNISSQKLIEKMANFMNLFFWQQISTGRYLHESNYEYSMLNSRLFKGSRNMQEGKVSFLREKRLGKKQKKSKYLSKHKEDILWKCGQLGDKTLKSAISTLWRQLTQCFGLRRRQEHHSIRIKDSLFVKLKLEHRT